MSEHTNTSNVFSLSATFKINQHISLRQVDISSRETDDIANIMKAQYSRTACWDARGSQHFVLEVFYSLILYIPNVNRSCALGANLGNQSNPDTPGLVEVKQS